MFRQFVVFFKAIPFLLWPVKPFKMRSSEPTLALDVQVLCIIIIIFYTAIFLYVLFSII